MADTTSGIASKYRIIIYYAEERRAFVARVPELQTPEVEAPTRHEALARAEQELQDQMENMAQQGITPPLPLDSQTFDGKLELKVSSDLHRELAFLAKVENVELPQLLTEVLARAVAGRWAGGERGSGRQGRPEGQRGRAREPSRERYHEIMENREDFIEYVRSLEQGGGSRGGRGGHRGRR